MRSKLFLVAVAFPLSVMLAGCAAESADPQPAPEPQAAAQPTEPAAPRRQGAASVDGTVDGAPFKAVDAVVFVGPLSTSDSSRRGIRIVLADGKGGTCATPDVVRAGDRSLSFDIDAADGTLSAGTYTVPSPFGADTSSVFADMNVRSSECSSRGVVALSGGTVTIDASDATSIRGSFELVMGRETVRGTFDATACDARREPALSIRCEM